MEKDTSPQTYAKKALEELEIAGKLEDKNVTEAIEHYEKATEYLERSGYMEHRIDDIKTRINQLKKKTESEKLNKKIEEQAIKDEFQSDAFEILDKARIFERNGLFEKAIEAYEDVLPILEKAGWTKEQIEKIKEKKEILLDNISKESDIKKQRDIQYTTQIHPKHRESTQEGGESSSTSEEKETEISSTQEIIPPTSQLDAEAEEVSKLKEQKKREAQRQDRAFIILDKAKLFEKKEDYENAIKNYQDAIEIFKEIKWENYIEPVLETIEHIKEKQKQKKEMDQIQIQREKNLSEIKESIKEKGKTEESSLEGKSEVEVSEKELQRVEDLEKKKEKEELLYSLLEKANTLYEKNSFDESINLYKKIKEVIKALGKDWERYIPKIETSISDIERKKQQVQYEEREKERRKQKAEEEEKRLIEQISNYVKKEKERAKHQELEKLRKQKDLQYREQQKEKAFKFLDNAQEYINEEDFDKAINEYQEAGNIFAEIQWLDELPLIQESIQELEKKRKEHNELKRARIQREIEIRKKDLEFNKKVLDQIDKEHEKLKIQELEHSFVESQLDTEHIKLSPGKTREIQREELRKYFEMQREDSFKLLEKAGDFMKQKDYDSAIDYYKRAESKLKEIKFPTNAIRETIDLIKIKKEEQQLIEQRKVHVKSQKLEKQREFQEMIASSLEKERKRLQLKQLKVEEYERSRELIEQKQNKAFNMLDEAEKLVKNEKYQEAVEKYREAQFLLNQIHYPTESIAEVIGKTILLKNQKEKEAELKLKGELQKLEEERILKQLEERRNREERKKKLAQHYAVKERERLIQEQHNIREAAYSLLDKGSAYLKQPVPDYNQAISMYTQAKNLLQEKIGWAPEIRNLENLIHSLRQENLELNRRQKVILEQEKKREQEYLEFQKELKERRKKAIEEQQKKEQKLRELETRKKEVIKRRDYALELITIGKNLSANQQFEEAYEKLNEAISVFKSIGWIDQIKYIRQEIKSIKELEAELKREALETQSYKEETKRREAKVQQLQIKKEKELEKAVGEVDVLTDEVSEIIEMKKKELILTEQQRQEQIKKEAKEFGKSMGEMIKIKEELLAQIRQAEKEEKLRQEEEERKKGRKEVDDIAKMLKEVAKKK